ncbi:MAG: hypothetical protein D6690_02340 [Nitrospirae bacterium]|nr:MAG: hypothetical protein D6690_02340 [Nitrospirota bacterium]
MKRATNSLFVVALACERSHALQHVDDPQYILIVMDTLVFVITVTNTVTRGVKRRHGQRVRMAGGTSSIPPPQACSHLNETEKASLFTSR